MNLQNKDISESIADSLVNIDDKIRSNLFTWRGQFSPQLVEHILLNYASKDSVVFDPFLGSGTVLFESALLGLEASGCEINPAAIAFAQVYELMNKPKHKIIESIRVVEKIVSKYTNDLPLFGITNIDEFEQEILSAYKQEQEKITRVILLALITGIDFEAKKLDTKRINNVWSTLRTNIENLPSSTKEIRCFQCDARKTCVNANSIDLVVTSPPYINVFNYHQNYRKSIEKTGVDVLSIAKSEIGANRKFRQNRFLTVVQYCMDMSQVFAELNRICSDQAKVIFVVGRESNVRKTPFKNAELITAVAELCGFKLKGEQTRLFKNKFGESIYEEILRFDLSDKDSSDSFEAPREIGINALKQALLYCSDEVKQEIKEAIDKSKSINVSPLLAA